MVDQFQRVSSRALPGVQDLAELQEAGNLGTVSAFDRAGGSLYVVLCSPNGPSPNDMFLAQVDVKTAGVVAQPKLEKSGLCAASGGGMCLEQMVWVG